MYWIVARLALHTKKASSVQFTALLILQMRFDQRCQIYDLWLHQTRLAGRVSRDRTPQTVVSTTAQTL